MAGTPRKKLSALPSETRLLGEAMGAGILPVQAIRAAISGGAVKLAEPAVLGQVQPASLDLRLGAKAYRVRASFLPVV